MEKQKYVRLEEWNQVIIFPCVMEHSAFKHLNPVSAGFCYICKDKIDCYGESVSLKLNSDPDDSYYATKQIYGFDVAFSLKNHDK